MADYPLTAEKIKSEFKRAGIRFVVALPDRVTSHYLLKGILADPGFSQPCKCARKTRVYPSAAGSMPPGINRCS